MPYATTADVQAHLPLQVAALGTQSQPSEAQVSAWLDSISGWIDGSLAWRYRTPVTASADLPLLREACALLVAGLVWQVLGSHGEAPPDGALALRLQAERLLAYQTAGPNAGRSLATLTAATLADTGEAALGQPVGSFTDPEGDGAPRLLPIDLEW